jgi:hypothetical protein
MIHEKQYRVSAKDGTTATLVPRVGERDPLSRIDPATPSQIVLTFTATPSDYVVNAIIKLRLQKRK